MKYKDLGYKKNFVIAITPDIGKTKDEIDVSKYLRMYNKRTHHSIVYTRKSREEEFVYYGCYPIDPDEEVIQID